MHSCSRLPSLLFRTSYYLQRSIFFVLVGAGVAWLDGGGRLRPPRPLLPEPPPTVLPLPRATQASPPHVLSSPAPTSTGRQGLSHAKTENHSSFVLMSNAVYAPHVLNVFSLHM